ncbi:MAG: aspartate-semialdehyde dehydrogenase [Bradymonadia bacterium]
MGDSKKRTDLVVAILGATGAVGEEILRVLEERDFPVGQLRPMASARSAGSTVELRGTQYTVESIEDADFDGVDLVLSSAGASVSKAHAHRAVEAGAVVVDNTSAFRMEPDVPLVVPEVNPEALDDHAGLIANPNCSTIQMVVALAPLHAVAPIKRVVVSTYQSASGAGRAAMDELRDQTVDLLNFRTPKTDVFARRLAFDCLPHIDRFMPDGDTKEELKMKQETRKIMSLPALPVSATCVRVPVFVGHALSVNVEFDGPITPEQAVAALESAPGVQVEADPLSYPMAQDAAGIDDVLVGRVRVDDSVTHGLNLWVVADNLRKGAATNSVQIAETLLEAGKL